VLEARNTLVPAVRTLVVQEDLQPRTIDLPGSMAAFDSATLYARATGYISVRNVDIGSKVHKGDVLAVIARRISISSLSRRRRSSCNSKRRSARRRPTPIWDVSPTSERRVSSPRMVERATGRQ